MRILPIKAFPDTGAFVRASVDLLLLTGSQIFAYLLRYMYAITFEGVDPRSSELAREYLRAFGIYLPMIAILGVSSCAAFGLYSRTRSYHWRAKTIAVAKAVTIPHIAVPLVLFLIPMTSNFLLPRSVLFLSWGISLGTMVVSRIWSIIWRHVTANETASHIPRPRDKRNVLLIGGAGYIGSALLGRLLDSGYKVRLLDIFLYGHEPIQKHLEHPNLEIIEGDFRRVEKVVSATRGMTSVIHLGGIVGDPACALDEQLTVDINLVASRMIAEVAKSEGVVRLVFASTCSVYGASDDVLDESSGLNPISLYARSKIASERVLLESAGEHLAPVILRFGTIFGFSGRTRFDLVVNLLAAKAVFEGKITLFGGDQWRPFVHVDDAARAVMAVMEAPPAQIAKEIFNVGSDNMNFTLQQVGELIRRFVPTAELLDFGANADRRNYRVSFEKIARVLGYQPVWTLEDGISQVVEEIRRGQITDYAHPKHSNVKFLNQEKLNELQELTGWERKVLENITPPEPVVARPVRSFTHRN